MSGRGKYDYKQNGPGDWTVLLFNYDIASSVTKKEHKEFLALNIIPLLKQGNGALILGQASTTGSAAFDLQISRARAQDVLTYLRREAGPSFPAPHPDGVGKSRALALTGIDNNEDEHWRAVWIRVWDKTHAPTNLGNGPFLPNVNPNITPNNSIVLDQVYDVIGAALGLADFGLDLAVFYGASAAVESLAVAVSATGLAVSVFSEMIALPAMWRSGDVLAEFNGKVQGYADAMQDMAEQYGDDSLDKVPVKKWNAIKQPFPHTQGALPTSAAATVWRHAQQVGCDMAFKDMLTLDTTPTEITTNVNGNAVKTKVNGKIVLRGLWVSTKGNVGVKVINQINAELRKQGKPNWPTH